MDLVNALIHQSRFEINLVIDELEVLFKVEYTDLPSKFLFKLISEDTDDRLYAYEYTFEREQSVRWNLEECIKKTRRIYSS